MLISNFFSLILQEFIFHFQNIFFAIVYFKNPLKLFVLIWFFFQVPRPSLAADGVALCLWYLAFCEEAIEKICVLPESMQNELVKYALWLLECSHQSSSTHAVMFFGMVFRFRSILEKFDEQDGLRAMLNMLSMMPLFLVSFLRNNVDSFFN